MFLADRVPALAHFRVDEGTTVLDALVDAAEALQVAELQQRHPERVDDMEQVGGALPHGSALGQPPWGPLSHEAAVSS